jgi:hypothetical protein
MPQRIKIGELSAPAADSQTRLGLTVPRRSVINEE